MKFACAAKTGCVSCITCNGDIRGVVSFENGKLFCLSSL
jgi:hypothetical protein